MLDDTIAAISTPFGEGAIALVRLSGPGAVAVADGLFRGSRAVSAMEPRVQHFGAIVDGDRKLDEVVLSVARGPASYTGEDVVEVACHGGVLVTRRLLELFLRSGARAAEPGEFTQRAFLNGKMDLTQAEAVMDLISAQTDLALRAATEQLEGRLGTRVCGLLDGLLELLAHIEAYIDFPDEDVDPETGDSLKSRLTGIRTELERLLATADQGKILREGVRTVIYGVPNVGKSSLLNLLLGYERAIVSATPGTTRDTLEEVINLRGIPLRLIDTAGVRESADEIERAGIERTRRQVERADLVLHLVDATAPRAADESLDSRAVLILNKTDLGEHPSWNGVDAVRISCLRHEGIEPLAQVIEDRVLVGGAAARDWSVAINTRHQAALQRALAAVIAAGEGLQDGLSPEFVAEEVRGALDAVGEVVGKVDTEDLLGKIFSTFCIGK
ncbi:MAG: tRNA uridine-5-carboxymethylaminomethyl(34) synthesis GTPase MnmE [Chthoniobacteraceae bacterium]